VVVEEELGKVVQYVQRAALVTLVEQAVTDQTDMQVEPVQTV
jgi:hypothetical protein